MKMNGFPAVTGRLWVLVLRPMHAVNTYSDEFPLWRRPCFSRKNHQLPARQADPTAEASL